MVATRTARADTEARWVKALDKAISLNANPIGRDAHGRYLIPSSTRPGLVYRTDGVRCDCPAGAASDPCCYHRALVRAALGMAPFAPEPPERLPAPVCPVCNNLGSFAVVVGEGKLASVACSCRRSASAVA